jgi:uncharacterized membrane protein YdjX (TVP38/TMEM64 family)
MATIGHLAATIPAWRRLWPVAALAIAFVVIYATGLHRYLTLEAVAEHRDLLKSFVASHLVAAILIYAAVYVLAVALSLPGAALLSIIGGFLFGWMVSAPVTIAAATIGAIIVFQIVKTSFGTSIAERAGPFAKKLTDGFAKDAFSYLLFLRLTPLFPFFAVNAVAGLANVRLSTFTLATLIGIIPGGIAFAYLGQGLDSVIDAQRAAHADCVAESGAENCTFSIDPSALITSELLIAFTVLGLVSLVPVILRKYKAA